MIDVHHIARGRSWEAFPIAIVDLWSNPFAVAARLRAVEFE